MAKAETIDTSKKSGTDCQTVTLSNVSLEDLIHYKEISDIMFEHYDNEAKSFLGEYDPITKSKYEVSFRHQNYFRMIREEIRREMERRLLDLDCADALWPEVFVDDEKVLG